MALIDDDDRASGEGKFVVFDALGVGTLLGPFLNFWELAVLDGEAPNVAKKSTTGVLFLDDV